MRWEVMTIAVSVESRIAQITVQTSRRAWLNIRKDLEKKESYDRIDSSSRFIQNNERILSQKRDSSGNSTALSTTEEKEFVSLYGRDLQTCMPLKVCELYLSFQHSWEWSQLLCMDVHSREELKRWTLSIFRSVFLITCQNKDTRSSTQFSH